MNKAELIDALRSQRERLEAALAGMSEAQIAKPGTADHWSVKDILAHLTFYERQLIDNLERAKRGEPPQEEEAETTDALNARVYARNRERPLADVLADFHQTYRRLLDVLQVLPEEILLGPSPFETPEDQRMWQYVAGDSFKHYQQHLDEIHP
jgi:uncharacterized protein (TIGR03083 family)